MNNFEYVEKKETDTLMDYLEAHNRLKCIEKIVDLPSPEMKNLRLLVKLFKEFHKKALQKIGKYEKGNLLLGAPENEYMPSDEELVLSEIGSRIKKIVQNAEIKRVEYTGFTFSHEDVMGSGRFFYAHPRKEFIFLPV